MSASARWEQCIAHYGSEVEQFAKDYLVGDGRRVLLIAGAGFDPRASAIATLLAGAGENEKRLKAIFLREERPDPDHELVARADAHAKALGTLIPSSEVVSIDVLSPTDGAVVGGQGAVRAIDERRNLIVEWATDVVLDMSALSIGISFPIAKYLLAKCEGASPSVNLHVMVAANSALDNAIVSVSGDAVDPVRGFSGSIDLAESATQPKIWLPHLAPGRMQTLQLIRDKLQEPVDICPVLPLSATDPRAADRLMLEFESALAQDWEIDPRNVVYAIEDDPLDLYRTISAIYHRFMGVLKDLITSHVVLSPSGNKVLSIGALMAALELDLPVRYVEAVQYLVNWEAIEAFGPERPRLVHVWLAGDAYPTADAHAATSK